MRGGRRLPPAAVLAILSAREGAAADVVRRAAQAAQGRTVAYLFVAHELPRDHPRSLFEIVDPYVVDTAAQEAFGIAERSAREHRLKARYLYVPPPAKGDVAGWVRTTLRPDLVVA